MRSHPTTARKRDSRHPAVRRLGVAVGVVALIGAAGCSGSSKPEPTGPAATPPDTAAPVHPPSATSVAPSTQSSTPTSTTTGDNDALLRAGATAEKAVSGSTLISIESERNGTVWDVEVVTSDGSEYEIDVSATGDKVISGPTEDKQSAADKAKHRQWLKDAAVDYRKAAVAVVGAVEGGKISELNLDTWNGRTVWEADVHTDSSMKREVKLDVTNAKVLYNRVAS